MIKPRRAVVPIVEAPRLAATPRLTLGPEASWRAAIDAWFRGDGSRVQRLLAGDEQIPGFARTWLADAVAGRVKRKRGRKPDAAYSSARAMAAKLSKEDPVRQWFRIQLVLCQLECEPGGTPTERAIELTAKRFDMTERQVSDIVHPRTRSTE